MGLQKTAVYTCAARNHTSSVSQVSRHVQGTSDYSMDVEWVSTHLVLRAMCTSCGAINHKGHCRSAREEQFTVCTVTC